MSGILLSRTHKKDTHKKLDKCMYIFWKDENLCGTNNSEVEIMVPANPNKNEP